MEKPSNRKILRRFPERIKKNKVVGKKKRLSFHKIKTDTTMAMAAQEEVEKLCFLMTAREKTEKVKHNCVCATVKHYEHLI
jgi:hypothetical protein